LQKDSCGHEQNFGDTSSFASLHPDMIAHSLATSFVELLRHSFRNIDSGESAWLCADNFDVLFLLQSSLQNVLWHLGSFATPCVSTDDQNSVSFKLLHDQVLVLGNRQTFGRLNGPVD
jgi:hypothetical protein